jgi:hypothetical protein
MSAIVLARPTHRFGLTTTMRNLNVVVKVAFLIVLAALAATIMVTNAHQTKAAFSVTIVAANAVQAA